MKKIVCFLLCGVFALALFSGCGASSKSMDSAMNQSISTAPSEEITMEEEAGWVDAAEPEEVKETDEKLERGEDDATDSDETVREKVIYTASLSVETKKFDQATASIEAMVETYGGYIQDSTISGDSWYNDDGTTTVVNRYAWYTLAVPVESFEEFLRQAGEIGNVTAENRNAENVTSQYMDTEARLQSLEVQEERLLAMMKETDDIESLIALEERLSEVTYEMESYERKLQNWDRRIAYSTVNVELREVASYTQTAAVNRSFVEKLTDALSDGWTTFVYGAEDFVLGIAEGLPMLVILAVVILLVLVVGKKLYNRKKAKQDAAASPAEKQNDDTV